MQRVDWDKFVFVKFFIEDGSYHLRKQEALPLKKTYTPWRYGNDENIVPAYKNKPFDAAIG